MQILFCKCKIIITFDINKQKKTMNHLIYNSKGQVQYHDDYDSNVTDFEKCEMCLNYFNEIKPVKAPEDFITLINKGVINCCEECIESINEYEQLNN